MPAGASAITYFKAGPFIWDVVMAVEGNWFVFVPLTILFVIGFWMIYKFYFKPRNAKAAEAEKQAPSFPFLHRFPSLPSRVPSDAWHGAREGLMGPSGPMVP